MHKIKQKKLVDKSDLSTILTENKKKKQTTTKKKTELKAEQDKIVKLQT